MANLCGDCRHITPTDSGDKMGAIGFYNCKKKAKYQYVGEELKACDKFVERGLFDPPLQKAA